MASNSQRRHRNTTSERNAFFATCIVACITIIIYCITTCNRASKVVPTGQLLESTNNTVVIKDTIKKHSKRKSVKKDSTTTEKKKGKSKALQPPKPKPEPTGRNYQQEAKDEQPTLPVKDGELEP